MVPNEKKIAENIFLIFSQLYIAQGNKKEATNIYSF
jgi:hypothetical protein